jgi:SAM-dependent methyltransferase
MSPTDRHLVAIEPPQRQGEYAVRGDYHRRPDPGWDYYPTYRAKMRRVRAYLEALPPGTRVLDAGCGEGLLVEEYAAQLVMSGVDAAYRSSFVQQASITALPFPDGHFGRALCLDVLEHLSFEDQARALHELARVLAVGGELLVSVPNLAHLQSRVQFLLRGRLIRTASAAKHPGDRPIGEYLALARAAGFALQWRRGIFPTVPVLTRFIRHHPARLEFLHRALTLVLPVPGWCFLNLLCFRRS